MKQMFRSVSGTSFLLTLARLAGAGLGILLQILIARLYGASILGFYFLALSIAAILAMLVSRGYPWMAAPIVARSEADKDPGSLSRFLGLVRRDMIFTTIILGLPGIALIWLMPDLGSGERLALLIGLVTGPVFAVMRMNGAIANAFKRFHLANLPELLFKPMLMFGSILIASMLAFQLDAVSIVAINFVVTCGLAVWMTYSLPVHARLSFATSKAGGKADGLPAAADISRWRKLALPMIFSTLFIAMFADLDLFMVGFILPAMQVGVLGVCLKIAALLVFTVQVVHQILLRDASDAHLADDRDKMHEIIRNANRFALLASLGSLVAILLFGNLVLSFFGTDFQAGYYCLVVLVGSQIIRAAAGPAIQILMICEKQSTGMPVYGVSIVVLLACNLILIPTYGYEGAAAAVVITTLFWCVWLNHVVKRETGYSISAFGAI